MYVNHRQLSVTLQPLKLILSIAAGIWLGFLAVALTGWLIYKALPAEQTQALSNVANQLTSPPPPRQSLTATTRCLTSTGKSCATARPSDAGGRAG